MKALWLCSLISLLMGQASADIVYLDEPDFTFPPGGPPAETSFQLLLNTPLNQNQGAEFLFKFQPPQVSFGREDVQAPTADVLSAGGFVQQLSLGSPIGPAQSWAASGLLSSLQWESDGTVGFLGVRANPATDSSTYYYGSVRIAYNPDSSITLFDWAYESTPNSPILAGAVPEPSTCLFLCLGTLSILLLRKRNA